MAEYLTSEEVADMLRMPPDSLRWWRYVGKGPKSFKVGRRVLYDRAEVELFLRDAQKLPR